MRVVVLSGSPKSRKSVTLRFVDYLGKTLPEVAFDRVLVGPRIRRIESSDEAFDSVVDRVAEADAVLWATPVYFWTVPAQLLRFVELVFERGREDAFAGKAAAALTTSIHFFDHTAHALLQATCEDLGMRYVGGLSADMGDLFRRRGRAQLRAFGGLLVSGASGELPALARRFPAVATRGPSYRSGPPGRAVDPGRHRVVLVTDDAGEDSPEGQMLRRLEAAFSGRADVVDLSALSIRGGCLGCLACGAAGRCQYEGKDDFIDVFNGRIASADIVVFVGAVGRRYLSSTWKTFFDRSFFNAHSPRFSGKQLGLAIAGPLSGSPHLREALEGWIEVQGASLVDVVTDEAQPAEAVDAALDGLAARLVRCADEGYLRPMTFLGVAGRKIFRDEVWGRLRPVFPVDHRYYREHGFYDFPTWKLGFVAMNALLGPVDRVPPLRDMLHDRLRSMIVAPYDRLLKGL